MADTPVRTVPYERFSEANKAKQAAEARIAELEKQLAATADLQARHDKLMGDLDAEKLAHKSTRQGVEEERAFLKIGLNDPEAITVARALYDRLPTEGKPKTLSDYAASWVGEDAKLDVTKLPKGLIGFVDMPKPAAPGVVTPVNPSTLPPRRPSPTAPAANSGDFATRMHAALASGDKAAISAMMDEGTRLVTGKLA